MFNFFDGIIAACARAIGHVILGAASLLVYVQFLVLFAFILVMLGGAGLLVWNWLT